LSGKQDVKCTFNERLARLKGRLLSAMAKLMVKDCPIHGIRRLMAIDVKFLTHIEKMFPAVILMAHDEKLHNHGTSTIKYGAVRPDVDLQTAAI